MKYFVLAAVAAFAIIAASCVSGPIGTYVNWERPQVNVPIALRQKNWIGSRGQGSCAHASMVTALRWQGQPAMADWWKRKHGNGAGYESLDRDLTNAGIRYAATCDQQDVSFLEWSVETRRGCVVAINGYTHAVFLAHMDDQHVGLIDNNQIGRVVWVDRETFLRDWYESRSLAIAVVYTPAPPLEPKGEE